MSKRVKRFVRPRVLVFAFALAVMLFSCLAAPPSRVTVRANDQETHITYYTDASLTTACGFTIILCQGWRAHNGCTTPYSTTTYAECQCEEINPC